MNKVTHGSGLNKTVDWHPSMPYLVKPKIRGSKIIEGVKYYLGYKGKIFIAEMFDKVFG